MDWSLPGTVRFLVAAMSSKPWYVYLLGCRTGRIYTGVSPDLVARFTKHSTGKGAMFTRLNRPEQLLATKLCPSKVEAMQVEYQIKRLGRAQKLLLASRWREEYPLHQLANQFPALVEYLV